MPDEPILEFENVSLRYGDAWALRNISLKLKPGETRIIFGISSLSTEQEKGPALTGPLEFRRVQKDPPYCTELC